MLLVKNLAFSVTRADLMVRGTAACRELSVQLGRGLAAPTAATQATPCLSMALCAMPVTPQQSPCQLLLLTVVCASRALHQLRFQMTDLVQEVFSKFGEVARLVLPDTRTLALVEMADAAAARKAFKGAAYKGLHHVPLFLEWAPQGIFTTEAALEAAQVCTTSTRGWLLTSPSLPGCRQQIELMDGQQGSCQSWADLMATWVRLDADRMKARSRTGFQRLLWPCALWHLKHLYSCRGVCTQSLGAMPSPSHQLRPLAACLWLHLQLTQPPAITPSMNTVSSSLCHPGSEAVPP